MLEFYNLSPPKYNPNSENDLFIANSGTAVYPFIIFLVIESSISGIYSYFYQTGFRRNSTVVISLIVVLVYGKELYSHFILRKKIMKKGTAFSGIIIFCKKYDAEHYGNSPKYRKKRYLIEIRYDKKTVILSGLDKDPSLYLENPYCTIYNIKRNLLQLILQYGKSTLPNGMLEMQHGRLVQFL